MRRRIKLEDKTKAIILPSIIYLAAILLVFWFLYLQGIHIPLRLRGQIINVNLSFIAFPIIALLFLRYLSELIKLLLDGELVTPLYTGFQRSSYTVFLVLLSGWSLVPQWWKPLTSLLLFYSILSMIHSSLSIYVKRYNKSFKSILNMLYIIIIGFITSQTWMNLYPYIESPILNSGFGSFISAHLESRLAETINSVILVSTSITAILSLSGILQDHPNTYLSYTGSKLSTEVEKVTIIVFLLIVYFLLFRRFLFEYSSINLQVIILAEWVSICLIFYLMYNQVKQNVADNVIIMDKAGTWVKHVQQIQLTSDQRQERLSTLVEDFINNGEKNELIVELTQILNNAEEPTIRIKNVVSNLIDHEDIPSPLISFPWQTEQIKRQNQQKRREIINMVLSSIQLKRDKSNFEIRQSNLKSSQEVNR